MPPFFMTARPAAPSVGPKKQEKIGMLVDFRMSTMACATSPVSTVAGGTQSTMIASYLPLSIMACAAMA